ncbi:MAG: rhodanese-like domain-containing protein [Ktedonobacterales bacterium]
MVGRIDEPVPELSAREAYRHFSASESDAPAALIDVREVWEFREGRARGAVNIPLSEFRTRVAEVPTDREVLFICHSGQRSQTAAKFARQQGIARVFNVDGGTDAWEAANLPMER